MDNLDEVINRTILRPWCCNKEAQCLDLVLLLSRLDKIVRADLVPNIRDLYACLQLLSRGLEQTSSARSNHDMEGTNYWITAQLHRYVEKMENEFPRLVQ